MSDRQNPTDLETLLEVGRLYHLETADGQIHTVWTDSIHEARKIVGDPDAVWKGTTK